VFDIYAANAVWKIPYRAEFFYNLLNISTEGFGICPNCRAIHIAQLTSFTMEATVDFAIRIENESCLKDRPVDRYL
jgi:hypothetical protein